MVDYFSADETYPVQDAIAVGTPPDVPPHYDLTAFLSDSVRSRAPWRDMAAAESRVLYKYVEQQRIALGAQRDPRGIARALKVATLRMMGLDWNSDSLTDDDYDRMVESVALYSANHGTEDFISYMGYSLGLPLSGVDLWTTDYVTFGPGPQRPAIFDDPPGQWYPTTHVGVLYDQYAANASDADVQVLTDIFYRVAPINLVLAWVGTLVTLEVGPLLHDQKLYEWSMDTALCQYVPQLTLYLERNCFERSVDTAVSLPLYPNRTIPQFLGLIAAESCTEGAVAGPVGVSWASGSDVPPGMQVQGGYVALTALGSSLVEYFPGGQFRSLDGASAGVLCQPDALLLQSASSQPQMSNWAKVNVGLAPEFALPDATQGFRAATTAAGGYLASGTPPQGTDCVVLKFRPVSGSAVTLSRGASHVTFDTGSSTVSSNAASYGLLPLGSTGFYAMWAVMAGTQVLVLPGGASGSGSIDWLDCQIVAGAAAPFPIPSTIPTEDAYAQATTLTFYGNAAVPSDLTALKSNQDASAEDLSADFYGGDANYYFYGGVALYYQLINLPTASVPKALVGTQVSLPGATVSRSFGFAHFRTRNLEAVSPDQTLFSVSAGTINGAPDPAGIAVLISGRTLTLQVGGASASLSLPSGSVVDAGVRWDASGATLYAAGETAGVLPVALARGAVPTLMSSGGSDCTGSWVLESIVTAQTNDAALLPTGSYMAAATASESGG